MLISSTASSSSLSSPSDSLSSYFFFGNSPSGSDSDSASLASSVVFLSTFFFFAAAFSALLAKYRWKKTSDGSTSDSMSEANSSVPGIYASLTSAFAARMTSEPPLDRFFGFFCNHLSRKTVSVMSARGSPSYSIGLP